MRYHPHPGQRHQYAHHSVLKLLSNPASYQPQYGPLGSANAGKALVVASTATSNIPSNARSKILRFITLRSPSLTIGGPYHPHAYTAFTLARAGSKNIHRKYDPGCPKV